MKIYARQGDLIIEKLAKDQKFTKDDLVKRVNIVFAGDSSGHRHRLRGTVLVEPPTGRNTRFRLPEPTQLVHEKPDGHEAVKLAAGDYEIRPLRERGDGSDRAVED